MTDLRLLVLAADYPPARGGIQLLLGRLVDALRGVEVRVVAPAAIDPPRYADSPVVRRSPRIRGGSHRAAVAALNFAAVMEAARFRPDVVLSGHIVTSPAAWMIARSWGIPYVQYVYGKEVATHPRLTRSAVRRAAATITISAYVDGLLARLGAPDRLHRVFPGVDPARPGTRERSGRPRVATVARLAELYKGHDVMLRALPIVRQHVPDVEWVVVGDGPLRRFFQSTAGALGLTSSVTFATDVDDVERDRILDTSNIFAMPSRIEASGAGEGFGIAYLEAGLHGLPIVAGNVGGARDAVVDGITGILVDPLDHWAVANALCMLLTEQEQSATMGRAGEERAAGFTWDRMAQGVRGVLTEVTKTGR